MAQTQWIRPWTLSREVIGSNLLAAAVVPLGKALYPHRLVPWKGLKAVGPLVACLSVGDFLHKRRTGVFAVCDELRTRR